jgi:hypothetical protein
MHAVHEICLTMADGCRLLLFVEVAAANATCK